MTPDTLATVRRGSTVADVEALCAATGFSRFPVVAERRTTWSDTSTSRTCSSRTRPSGTGSSTTSWIRPFAPVLATDALHEALETLRAEGPTWPGSSTRTAELLGLATLEDVIEELIGEIRDAAHQDEPAQP